MAQWRKGEETMGGVPRRSGAGDRRARASASPRCRAACVRRSEEAAGELEAMRKQAKKQCRSQLEMQQKVIDKLSAESRLRRRLGGGGRQGPGAKTGGGGATRKASSARSTGTSCSGLRPQLAGGQQDLRSQFTGDRAHRRHVGSYGQQDARRLELRAARARHRASVDPFARGYAIITGATRRLRRGERRSQNLVHTTSLQGGRFLRRRRALSKFHDPTCRS